MGSFLLESQWCADFTWEYSQGFRRTISRSFAKVSYWSSGTTTAGTGESDLLLLLSMNRIFSSRRNQLPNVWITENMFDVRLVKVHCWLWSNHLHGRILLTWKKEISMNLNKKKKFVFVSPSQTNGPSFFLCLSLESSVQSISILWRTRSKSQFRPTSRRWNCTNTSLRSSSTDGKRSKKNHLQSSSVHLHLPRKLHPVTKPARTTMLIRSLSNVRILLLL